MASSFKGGVSVVKAFWPVDYRFSAGVTAVEKFYKILKPFIEVIHDAFLICAMSRMLQVFVLRLQRKTVVDQSHRVARFMD